jgi:tetrahydromethanopterin S-methyltransferase subunit G
MNFTNMSIAPLLIRILLLQLDGCDLLIWDDQLNAVNAANGEKMPATAQVGQEFGRAFGHEFGKEFGHQFGHEFGRAFGQQFGKEFGQEFGQEFGRAFGQEFGKECGQEIGKAISKFSQKFGKECGQELGTKLSQFVWVGIIMCVLLFVLLTPSPFPSTIFIRPSNP